MAESIRNVSVTIMVDTNKHTHTKSITLNEDETLEEFEVRVLETLHNLTEVP